MRRRHKKHQEHANHERWLVSYADFITLLFAFFVVMYAVSSVNEGKYRVLSNTLTDAFQEPSRSIDPIQLGELRRSAGNFTGDALSESLFETENRQGTEPIKTPAPDGADSGAANEEKRRLGYIADTLESVLQTYVDQGQVSVNQKGSWVEVDMKSAVLFTSGSATLSNTAVRMLSDVSRVLRPLPNELNVEGYTDNVPISTAAFPSNWELSAARAASVVHLFTRLGVGADRLAAIGYGEHRPIADNASAEGRARNRRVVLIVGAGKPGQEPSPGRIKQQEAQP